MNVYVIDRIDKYSYGDNYKAVVIAKDELHAERLARIKVFGFEEAKLKVTKINLYDEEIISIENTGG